MIAAIDWSHKKSILVSFDGIESIEKKHHELVDFLKSKKVDIVVGENVPAKISLELLNNNINVLRCCGGYSAQYRKDNDGVKSDSEDAKTIFLLYNQNPEVFYPYTKSEIKFLKIKTLYKLRDSLMKSRIQYGQRIDQYKKYGVVNPDIISRLSEVQRQLELNEDIIKRELSKNTYFGRYVNLFSDVKGVDTITVAHAITEIGDINRFPTQKKFLNYALGYKEGNKHNHALKVVFLQSARTMLGFKNSELGDMYYKYRKYLEDKGKTEFVHHQSIRMIARKIAILFYKRLKSHPNLVPFENITMKKSIVNMMPTELCDEPDNKCSYSKDSNHIIEQKNNTIKKLIVIGV